MHKNKADKDPYYQGYLARCWQYFWCNNYGADYLAHVLSGNSINNLLSYCGLVDARISASEKDLPVIKCLNLFDLATL